MRNLLIAALAVAFTGCQSEAPEQRPAGNAQVTPEPSGPPVVQQVQPEQQGSGS